MFGLTQGRPLVDEKAGCPDMIRACLRAHPRGCSSSHLIINGGLAREIHAPIALAFVLVYKASRMINFSLGEWIMFGSLLASTGSHVIADSTWVERCCLAASPWLYSMSGSMQSWEIGW
jgi:hypothetical protein